MASVMKTALFLPCALLPPALDKKGRGTPRVHSVSKDVSMTNLAQADVSFGAAAVHRQVDSLQH